MTQALCQAGITSYISYVPPTDPWKTQHSDLFLSSTLTKLNSFYPVQSSIPWAPELPPLPPLSAEKATPITLTLLPTEGNPSGILGPCSHRQAWHLSVSEHSYEPWVASLPGGQSLKPGSGLKVGQWAGHTTLGRSSLISAPTWQGCPEDWRSQSPEFPEPKSSRSDYFCSLPFPTSFYLDI